MEGYNEIFMLGAVIVALITIGSFITLIIKLMGPINQLNLAVQELRDLIRAQREQLDVQNRKLEEHAKAIDQLNLKFERLATQVDMYHNN